MECELLRSPMISYRSLLYNTTVLYDIQFGMPNASDIIAAYVYSVNKIAKFKYSQTFATNLNV